MNQLKILIFGIVLPVVLSNAYDYFFRYAGNWGGNWFWLEDYKNYFEIGLLLIALVGTLYLAKISYRNNKIWLALSVIVSIGMIIYIYLSVAFLNMSFP